MLPSQRIMFANSSTINVIKSIVHVRFEQNIYLSQIANLFLLFYDALTGSVSFILLYFYEYMNI